MPAVFRTSADAAPSFERLNEEFRRRAKTQRALPKEHSALILLWGLVATRQKLLRKSDRCTQLAAVILPRMRPGGVR